jgi:hypothetical protein
VSHLFFKQRGSALCSHPASVAFRGRGVSIALTTTQPLAKPLSPLIHERERNINEAIGTVQVIIIHIGVNTPQLAAGARVER